MRRTNAHGVRSAWRRRVLHVLVAVISATTAAVVMDPLASPAAAQAATTYANPQIAGLTANPFILKSGSTYYAYVSGFDYLAPFPVLAFSSPDLATWTMVGNVLPPATAGAWADLSSGSNVSSPSVLHAPTNPSASRYVLYFSAKRSGSTERCIGVATGTSPTGPFTGRAQPLICPPAAPRTRASCPSVPAHRSRRSSTRPTARTRASTTRCSPPTGWPAIPS